MKVNDIYYWSYIHRKGQFAHWCCSKIGIVKERQDGTLYMEDTYWSSSQDNKRFSKEDIGTRIEVTYIGNFDDLERCDESELKYYNKEDTVDLRHPNNTRGNVYIRKGATRSLDKMKRIVQAHIDHYERKVKYMQDDIVRLKGQLETLTVDSWIPSDKEVWHAEEG